MRPMNTRTTATMTSTKRVSIAWPPCTSTMRNPTMVTNRAKAISAARALSLTIAGMSRLGAGRTASVAAETTAMA